MVTCMLPVRWISRGRMDLQGSSSPSENSPLRWYGVGLSSKAAAVRECPPEMGPGYHPRQQQSENAPRPEMARAYIQGSSSLAVLPSCAVSPSCIERARLPRPPIP